VATENTAAAAEGADLLVSHPLAAYVAWLVAEKERVPWVLTMLVPIGFFSVHEETALLLPAFLSLMIHQAPTRIEGTHP
jgi:hypothetical protein